jgi:hypothetical protein
VQPNDTFFTRLTGARLWLAALLLATCQVGFAQAPSGTFTFSFDKTVAPLIDLQGSFSPTNQVINGAGDTSVPLLFDLPLTNAGNGRLKGSGPVLLQVGQDFVAADYRALGTIHGGGTRLTRVNLSVLFTGEGPVAGVDTRFRIIITYNLALNVDDWALEGVSRGSAQFSGLGRGIVKSPVTVPLSGSSDGAWTATLNILALKNLGGSGTITLPTGRAISGVLAGSFLSRANIARVRFIGTGDAKGTAATFFISPSEDTNAPVVQTVRGRILGQTILE